MDVEPATVDLPRDAVPMRVRFRFASDGDTSARGWEIAGAGTITELPRASLEVRERGGGALEVVSSFAGEVTGIDQVRFRYRVPGQESWLVASAPISLRSSDTTVRPIEVPVSVDVFEIGLFAELGAGVGGGSTPDLLLGRTGYRRSPSIFMPRVVGNPARGRLVLEVPVRDVALELRVVDVRGREAARPDDPGGRLRLRMERRPVLAAFDPHRASTS